MLETLVDETEVEVEERLDGEEEAEEEELATEEEGADEAVEDKDTDAEEVLDGTLVVGNVPGVRDRAAYPPTIIIMINTTMTPIVAVLLIARLIPDFWGNMPKAQSERLCLNFVTNRSS